MKTNTKFSVIVPIFNTKREFLIESLDSLVKQNYNNYELILIDDGSNQETKEILKNYKNAEHVILIHQNNVGMVNTRLNGLKVATGDYILHVDSDDILLPDSLFHLDSIIQTYNPDIVLHDFVRFSQNTNNITERFDYFKNGIVSKEEVIQKLCEMHINSICNKCARRNLYDYLIKNVDTRIVTGEDFQQSTALILQAETFYYTHKHFYFYRVNEEKRDYYKIENVHDVNFIVPPYKMLFVDNNEYSKYLGIFKAAAVNSVIFNAIKICKANISYKQKKHILDELNKQEAITVLEGIKEKIPFLSSAIYFALKHKWYFVIYLVTLIYKTISK